MRNWICALTAAAVLSTQSLAYAETFSLPSQGGASSYSPSSTSPSSVQISPDAFKSLSLEQQRLINQRMQPSGSQPPASSETRKLTGDEPSAPTADAPQAQPEPVGEELSAFERILAEHAGPGAPRLRQFGYDLFTGVPSTFAPVNDMPVPSDFVVGPGDEVIISALSPRRSGDYSLTVSREGTIFYPNIGTLPVAGMTYSRMVTFLTQKIKGGATDLQLSIRMGKLRSIQVFVVGRTRKPGAYTVSALSTLSNALMASGGATKAGSLRDIQLKRGGKVVARFDFYDFLLNGDSTQDLRLQSGDVIFVPNAGALVAVSGNVRVPAIYELKGKTTLQEVLGMAGGVNAMGYTQQIQIERFHQNQAKKILDVDLERLGKSASVALQDGDLVGVSSITPKLLNSVFLDGNVERPGKYEFRPDLRVRDVIKNENDLKPESYMDFALIERVMPPDAHIELIPFHLGKALAGVTAENKYLTPGDTIRVYYRWDIQEPPKVRIAGPVGKSGEFRLHPKMTVAELVHLAGGLQDHSDKTSAELTRVQVVDNQMVTRRITLNLERALRGEAASNLTLQKDDYLLIKPVPDYKLYRTVTLQGEVAQPGTYTFKDGETLSDVIDRSGGVTKRAYLKGAIYTRESVKRLQAERLQDLSKKLEAEILRESNQQIAGALSGEAAKANQEAMASKQALLSSIRETQASGRMIVSLERVIAVPHSDADVQLEEGDVLVVPSLINSVSVLGQVFNPTAITYVPGMTMDDYLAKTGGATKHADTQGIYIIRADGSVLTDQIVQSGWGPWRKGIRSTVLEPGDTVMVPENLAVDTTIRDVRDITQILYQIATTAAVTWGLLRR